MGFIQYQQKARGNIRDVSKSMDAMQLKLRHKQQKGQQAFEAFHENSQKKKSVESHFFISPIDKYIYQLKQYKF